ncbi:hypothetical protein MMC17_007396 [Xylographa soralifera]|nr:hypothetical protein [Xylographa soralifera]
MGRKPNQLVLEFFSRGPKLEDASNRYQYTCKACGEHFAKGRMENLASHLAKQCGALSGEDRNRALLQLRQVPEQSSKDRLVGNVHGGGSARGFDGRDEKPSAPSSSVTVPSVLGKRLSGLEALAEASRRVEYPVLSLQDENVIDPSLKEDENYERLFDAEGRVQNELATSIAFDSDQFLVSSIADPSLPSGYSIADQALGVSTSTSGTAIDLANIAASASHLQASLMETEPSVTYETKNGHGPFDVYSEIQALRSPSTWPSKRIITNRSPSSERVAGLERASTHPYDPAYQLDIQHMSDPFGEQHHRVQKIRGKFSDVRRKEVQEVRKKGACIRCRMLRKTCSGGDPCGTCSGIESARLWKTPCMRTRIASDFELYSTGLYGKLAQQEVDRAQSGNTKFSFTKCSSQIIATHVRDSDIYLSFGAVISDLPESKFSFEKSSLGAIRPQLLLLDSISLDSTANLDKYVKVIGPYLHEEDPSQFMKATIGVASDLCVERNDILLSQATELWNLTTLLLDSDPQWKIYTYNGPPSNIHLHILPDRENLHPLSRHTADHRHIRTQLRALTEQQAAKLSRSLLHDLERRLLQKSHSQSFGTFLVALVLLACVERMCWLYHAWDRPERRTSWPLHYPPPYYSQQGDAFSELICMLLRMRGVPPKTAAHPESGFLAPVSTDDVAVVRWFEEVQLSNTYLRERAAAPFDAEDPRCWELRFAGKLLLA